MDPVKHDIAMLPLGMGGLQIVDLEKKSQAIKNDSCPRKFKYTMIEILNQYKQANLGKSVFKIFLNLHAA